MPIPSIHDLADDVRLRSAETDLARLAGAIAVSEELSGLADAIVGQFVEQARRGGCSWAQVGAVLGVTRQAAQQGGRRAQRNHPAGYPPAERLRAVLDLARAEAERLRHDWVGTEHLLLALVHDTTGIAAKVLRDLGVTLDGARAKVESTIGLGAAGAGPPDRPFTRRAKQVLDLAQREAARLHHDGAGPEHVLLGLVAEGRGLAAQVLVECGIHLPDVRRRVLDLVADATPSVRAGRGRRGRPRGTS